MPTLLIYPGTRGASVALQDVLREAHEAMREQRARVIEARKKKRVPLDDDTDWQAVIDKREPLIEAITKRDTGKVEQKAMELLALVAGHELAPIDEYEPDPALDGIMVTMQVLADADRRMWSAETTAAWKRVEVAADPVAKQEALNTLDAIAAKVVASVVVEIGGTVDLEGKSVSDAMPALVLAGLLAPLYQAARYFLELPAPKAVRCGLPPQST